MAMNPKLMLMITGKKPVMSSAKEEKAEKAGKKGFPKDSAKEEAAEMPEMPIKKASPGKGMMPPWLKKGGK